MEFDAIWCSVLRVPRSTVGSDWRFKILSGSHLQDQLRAENVDTSAIANSPPMHNAHEGPVSRTSRNFSSDIKHPVVSSIRRLFEHWNLSVILPPFFDLFSFATISGWDAATAWANREFKIYDATAATTPQILHISWSKTKALHALHVPFTFLYISFPFSANLRREMTTSQVLQRTWRHSCEFEFPSFPTTIHTAPTTKETT